MKSPRSDPQANLLHHLRLLRLQVHDGLLLGMEDRTHQLPAIAVLVERREGLVAVYVLQLLSKVLVVGEVTRTVALK